MDDRRGGLIMGDDSVWQWMRRAPAERMSLPASCTLWAAAECLHLGTVPGLETGLTSLAVAGVAFGAGKGGRHGRQAAVASVLAGGWLTAADIAGPLAGAYHPLTITWGIGTLLGYRWLRGHEKIRSAREWRAAKADWLERRGPAYGLHGSHLLKYETTRLGDAMVVDVKGTGKRASSLVHGSLAEDIAEVEMLAVSRVQVTLAGIAGRIRISIRRVDPWKHDILHPALSALPPEIDLPTPCTVREPLIVGIDPETGRPLLISLWNKHGGLNVLLTGMKGAGKGVLLSCIRERLTACPDALIFDINVSKALEDIEWAPACNLTAAGMGQRKRALHILRCAHRAIDYRAAQRRDTAVFQPAPGSPLIVITADEIDELTGGGDFIAQAIKAELKYITSKGRSEAVTVILSGQRATAEWLGGADIRSQIDLFCIGKVGRRGEMIHAAGQELGLTLPDMANYGEGHPGVWCIAELGGGYTLGRTFKLDEPPDLRRLAAERSASRPDPEPGLVEAMGTAYVALRARQPVMAGSGGPPPPPEPAEPTADPMDALDGEMEDMLPPELRDKLKRMDLRRRETTEINAETDAIMAALPEVDPAALAAHTAARWDAAGEETEIPPDVREKLIMLLAGDGMSGRKITEAFPGVKRWQVMLWLNRLRFEGNARIEGKGRGARWMIISRPAEGDGQ